VNAAAQGRAKEPWVVWLVRALWPFSGGLWGAWLGAGGFFDIRFTGDSLAAVLVGGYFVAFAVLGLVVGAITGAVVGGATEFLLRRLRLGSALALLGASLLSFWVCLALSGAVQRRYPGIHPPLFNKPAAQPKKSVPREISPPPTMSNPCLGQAPEDARLRRAWEQECR